MDDFDQILSHCPLDDLRAHVEGLEPALDIRILRQPTLCLTMVRAEDSLEKQEFNLGEALTTECEVEVNGVAGYGISLGEDPVRAYCVAVLDALREQDRLSGDTMRFLEREREIHRAEDRRTAARAERTRVDFKLLEQE